MQETENHDSTMQETDYINLRGARLWELINRMKRDKVIKGTSELRGDLRKAYLADLDERKNESRQSTERKPVARDSEQPGFRPEKIDENAFSNLMKGFKL